MNSQVYKGEEDINGSQSKTIYVRHRANRKAHSEQTSKGPVLKRSSGVYTKQ
jgi:hypothetical protein